jgi:hypothetical protein
MYIPVPLQGAVSEWNRYMNNLIKLSLTFVTIQRINLNKVLTGFLAFFCKTNLF